VTGTLTSHIYTKWDGFHNAFALPTVYLIVSNLAAILNYTLCLKKNNPTAKHCNLYIHLHIHTDFKILSSLLNGVKVGAYSVKYVLFSVSSLKDEKLIKKQTYMKTETCKLYFYSLLKISAKYHKNRST